MAFGASTGAPLLASQSIEPPGILRARSTRFASRDAQSIGIIRTAIPAITKNIFDRKNGP
jgi:hypothetical protein